MARFTHAVLMGDLVASEAAGSRAHLHRVFNAAVAGANRRHRRGIASPLTITLGDEFQGLTRTVSGGLEIMRELREALLAEDVVCRFVLGLARVETPVNPKRAWNMMGQGLAEAREKLGRKRHPSAYRFSLPGDTVREALLDAVGYSLSEVESHWTDRQFELARAARSSADAVEASAELGVALRTFYKIRRAARLDFYENQWDALKLAAKDLDHRLA